MDLETIIYKNSAYKSQGPSSLASRRSRFPHEKLPLIIKRTKKIQKVVTKWNFKPLLKRALLRKMAKRRRFNTPEHSRISEHSPIQSPLSEPFDNRSPARTEFSFGNFGSMIGQMNLAFSDNEGDMFSERRKSASLFDFGAFRDLANFSGQSSPFRVSKEDDDITSGFRKLNL